jgi:hypothetical protein
MADVRSAKLTAAALAASFTVLAVVREHDQPHVPDGGPPLPANGTRHFNVVGTATTLGLYTPRVGGSALAP